MEDPQNEILVSICCTAYNHEKYIEQALEGFVMQQCNFKFEILVSDDASTDNTASIIKRYESNYPYLFQVFYLNENQYSKGNKPLFNILFPATKGKYIALCEGDDYWTDPLKLQKQVDFLEENEEYSMCFTNRSVLDENNILKSFAPLERDYNVVNVLEGFVAHTLTIMFRNTDAIVKKSTSFIFNVGDRPLTYFCSLAGKVKLLKDDTAVYRYNGLGAWSSKKDDNLVYQNLKNLKQFHTLVGINNYQYLLVSASNNFLSNILKKKNFSNFIRLNQQLRELEIPVNKVYIHIANYYLSILKRKLKI